MSIRLHHSAETELYPEVLSYSASKNREARTPSETEQLHFTFYPLPNCQKLYVKVDNWLYIIFSALYSALEDVLRFLLLVLCKVNHRGYPFK